MADFTDILGTTSGLLQQFQAANMVSQAAKSQAGTIRVGGEIAAQGALLSAAGFRQSAEAVKRATQFNLTVDAVNNQRRLKGVSRQFQRALGRQLNQQARTGLGLGSKSFLLLRNEALDSFERSIINIKVDTENQRRSRVFESQVKQVNLENQARAAEFRAAAERVMASNRAAETAFQGEIATFRATQSAIRGIPTVLGQIFQG